MGLLTGAHSPNSRAWGEMKLHVVLRSGGAWELLIFYCSKSLSKIPRKSFSQCHFLSFEVLFKWKDGFKSIQQVSPLPGELFQGHDQCQLSSLAELQALAFKIPVPLGENRSGEGGEGEAGRGKGRERGRGGSCNTRTGFSDITPKQPLLWGVSQMSPFHQTPS